MRDNIQVTVALIVGLFVGVVTQVVAVREGTESVAAGGLGTAVAFIVGFAICNIRLPKKGD